MYEDRILSPELRKKVITADEAAALIKSNMVLCVNGFGQDYPKAIPMAVAKQGTAKNLTLISAATDGDRMGGILSQNGQLGFFSAFHRIKELRENINSGKTEFNDCHLSQLAYKVSRGDYGKVDFGIYECVCVYEDGSILPTLSGGIASQIAKSADKILLEINLNIPTSIKGLHDFVGKDCKKPSHPTERVGSPVIPCDPDKIVGIVISNEHYRGTAFSSPDEITDKIASNVMAVIQNEIDRGLIPENFTFQSGMGNMGNALIAEFTKRGLKGLKMHTEVVAESAFQAIMAGTVSEAVTSAFDLSEETYNEIYKNADFVKEHLAIRDLDYVNAPENVRDSGVIATNTALEFDIYGNVNSSNIMGTKMVSGLGGSNDFSKMSKLAIFLTPSVAKGGAISSVVPMVSQVDSTEHDTDVVVTEQGYADLRGLSPKQRARKIIENCVHPAYKQQLWDYFNRACELCHDSQTPHDLEQALSWHIRYQKTGSMLEQK